MNYLKIALPAVIEVSRHKNLIAAWALYGPGPIVGTYVVTEPLTATQFRRLPSELRARVKCELLG